MPKHIPAAFAQVVTDAPELLHLQDDTTTHKLEALHIIAPSFCLLVLLWWHVLLQVDSYPILGLSWLHTHPQWESASATFCNRNACNPENFGSKCVFPLVLSFRLQAVCGVSQSGTTCLVNYDDNRPAGGIQLGSSLESRPSDPRNLERFPKQLELGLLVEDCLE